MRDDIADAMQDAILSAYEHIGELRTASYFKTWLTRILINCCMDQMRQRKGLVSVEWAQEPSVPGVESDYEFYELLKALPEEDRILFLLYYGEGFNTREIAEALLGENGMSEPVEVQLGEHTLRVEDLVYDKNTAFLYFTLERQGGVTALQYSADSNRTKGAVFSEDIDFYFNLEAAEETPGYRNIFVDLEKSTEEKLYCYAYVIWGKEEGISEGDVPQLHIYHYPCARKDLTADKISGEEVVPLTGGRMIAVKAIDMGENGLLEYSPVSLSIDMAKGMEFSAEEAMEPFSLGRPEIKYKDGSSYVILDRGGNVESYGYLCGIDAWTKITLDRLVDVDEIQEIVVNDTAYMVE